MINRYLIALFLMTLPLWLVLLWLALVSRAQAQPVAPEQPALVAMWVGESGWLAYREHAIQAHILARWAKRMGLPLYDAIDLRVFRFSRPARWVRNVGPDCVRPNGWPWRLSWDAHAPLCRELYARADMFLGGELEDPCPSARGWRRRGDALAEALSLGRRLVRCGRTANGYIR